MPLSSLNLVLDLQWQQYRTNGQYANSTQGDLIAFTLAGLNLSTWNQLYVDDTVLVDVAGGASVTLDLTSLQNLNKETVDFDAVLAIVAVGGTNAWTIAPGGSDGLQINGGEPLDVPAAGAVAQSYAPGSAGLTVDPTHKKLTITNTGGTTDTLAFAILGGT